MIEQGRQCARRKRIEPIALHALTTDPSLKMGHIDDVHAR